MKQTNNFRSFVTKLIFMVVFLAGNVVIAQESSSVDSVMSFQKASDNKLIPNHIHTQTCEHDHIESNRNVFVFTKDNFEFRVYDSIPTGIYGISQDAEGNTPVEKSVSYLKSNWNLFGHKDKFESTCHLFSEKKRLSGTILRYRQVFKGLPVDNNEFMVKINNDSKIVFVLNSTRPVGSNFSIEPLITFDSALKTVPDYLMSSLNITCQINSSKLIVHFIDDTPILCYKISAFDIAKMDEYIIFVSAISGGVLEIKNITCRINGTGSVYIPDPLTSSGQLVGSPGFDDDGNMNNPTLFGEQENIVLLDITEENNVFTLDGPFASIASISDPQTGGTDGLFSQNNDNFSFNRSDDGFEAVMCYYHLDRVLRYINNELLIDAMPTDYVGGVRFDPHGGLETNASYSFANQSMVFGRGEDCTDLAEDASVIIHELGHGIHNWLIEDVVSNAVGEGLSEGCGDYLAQSYKWSLWFDVQNSGTLAHQVGPWGFTCFPVNNLRTTNFVGTYPLAATTAIHAAGQLWSSTLMRIYSDIGRVKTDRIFLEGIALTNTNSTQLQAAEAVYQAAVDLGYSFQDLCIIYQHLNDHTVFQISLQFATHVSIR